MTEYTAFRIDQKTLEKLRAVADHLERSMAAQVRFMVDRQFNELVKEGKISNGDMRGEK